jgi:hypothetical protein
MRKDNIKIEIQKIIEKVPDDITCHHVLRLYQNLSIILCGKIACKKFLMQA